MSTIMQESTTETTLTTPAWAATTIEPEDGSHEDEVTVGDVTLNLGQEHPLHRRARADLRLAARGRKAVRCASLPRPCRGAARSGQGHRGGDARRLTSTQQRPPH